MKYVVITLVDWTWFDTLEEATSYANSIPSYYFCGINGVEKNGKWHKIF